MNVDDCKKAKKELENDLTQGAMFRMSGYELVAMNRQEGGEDCSEKFSKFEEAASQMTRKENLKNYRIIKVAATFEYEASQRRL